MQAYQTMVASDGYEVMLFPLPYMAISQGEGGTGSHDGTYNMDFIGWGPNGRIYDAPLYAPCSCRCVATVSSINNGRIFTSLNKVHTPNGLQYVSFMTMHDETPPSVGSTFNQGEIFAHTGLYGQATGDHTHFNTANGAYAGYETTQTGHTQLVNSTHIYDICYVNNTVLTQPLSYPWVTYSGGTIESLKKGKFPWVLYARKLRKKY